MLLRHAPRVRSMSGHTWVVPRIAGALLLCTCVSAQAEAAVTRADWGTTTKGEKVELYTLTGPGGLEARITNFGGVIVSLNVPNRKGSTTDARFARS